MLPFYFGILLFASSFVTPIPVLYSKVIIDAAITGLALVMLMVCRTVLILADRDNLLAFGVDRTRLLWAIAIMIFVLGFPFFILIAGFSELIAQAYPVSAGYKLLSILLLFPALIFMSTLGLSGGNAYASRVIILVTAVDFSNVAGNPFSMGNISTIYYPFALITEAVFLLSVFIFAVRSARKFGFSYSSLLGADKRITIKHPMEMKERRGVKAEFRLWFRLAPFYRYTRRTSATSLTKRLTLTRQVVYNVIIFTLVSALFVFQGKSLSPFDPDAILLVVIAGYAIIFALIFAYQSSFNSISHERLWISFAAVENSTALRTHLLAKSLATTLSIVPVLLLPASFALTGQMDLFARAIYPLVFLCAAAFPSMVIMQVLNAYLSTEQIHDDTIPQQGVIMRVAASIPVMFVLISTVIVLFDPGYIIWAFAALLVVSLPLLLSTKVFEKEAVSMIKRGFV